MADAPALLTSNDAYTPPSGLTPTKTSGGGTGYTDQGGNMYVQSSPGRYTLLNQVSGANTAPTPTSASATNMVPPPTVITPQAAQTQINDIKSKLDDITKQVAARSGLGTGTANNGGTGTGVGTGTGSDSGTSVGNAANIPLGKANEVYYYTASQDSQGKPQYVYYDSNGNVLPTNPIGGDSYAQNPQDTPNSQGRLVQLSNAPTEGGFTNTPLTSDQQNSILMGLSTDFAKKSADFMAQGDKMYSDLQNKLNQFETGSIPLTASQQAIYDATKSQFQQLRAQQLQANTTYENGLRVFEARSGELTGGIETAMGNVQNAINVGIQKLSEIDSQTMLALSKLQQGFEQDNLKIVEDAYKEWTDYATQKEKTMNDIYTSTSQSVKDLRDWTQKQSEVNFDQNLKKTATDLEQNKFTYQQAQDKIKNALDQSKFSLEERKVKLQEANAALISSAIKTMNSTPTPKNANLDPQVRDKWIGDNVPASYQESVKALLDYTKDPAGLSSRIIPGTNTSERTLVTGYAKLVDPTFSEAEYPARKKFLQNWTSGGQNSVTVSANTAVQHLAELKGQADALKNADAGSLGPFTTKYNSAKQWLSEGSGNPAVLQYKQTAVALAGEMAKIYKNSIGSSAAPTDDEVKYQLEILTTGLSPKQANAVIENGVTLMTDRLISAKENYESIMGKSPTDILSPTSRSRIEELKQKGINIDISGLNPLHNTSNEDLISGLGGAGQKASSTSDNTNLLLQMLNMAGVSP